ncbi:MAG: hypothetical protein OQJ81_06875 [Melioribacteraceae bacterium]|nr:hypothetical protein [Melioribacteraceae bacterium]
MIHTCFHAKADHHDQYVDSIEEAKHLVTEWSEEGDSHIQIFKLSADEMTDYINLDEELVYLDNTNY